MKPFTFEYAQPEEYRFSLDSVEAPWEIACWVRQAGKTVRKVLDLCAGSGVMGLEFAFHCPETDSIDFVELQGIYREYFGTNCERWRAARSPDENGRAPDFQWLEMNYESLLSPQYAGRYDLILSNPPYFLPTQGKLSPSEFKNRCRFFGDSTPDRLWDSIAHVLAPGGVAFVLLRPLQEHGHDLFDQLTRRLRYSARIDSWRQVRGTDLIRIQLFE